MPEPGKPQSFNRYSYTRGNPVKFTDPGGHAEACDDSGTGLGCGASADLSQIWEYFAKYGNYNGAFADYYAALYVYIMAVATGGTDPAILSTMEAGLSNYYEYAKNSVPQESAGAFLLPSPEEAFGAANLMVEGGHDIAGLAIVSPPAAKVAEIWRGFRDKLGLNDLRPGRNDIDGLSFNITQEGAIAQSGKPSAAPLELEAMLKSGNWTITDPDASGHVFVTRALDVQQQEWYAYYWGGPWTSTKLHHPYTKELYSFVRHNR